MLLEGHVPEYRIVRSTAAVIIGGLLMAPPGGPVMPCRQSRLLVAQIVPCFVDDAELRDGRGGRVVPDNGWERFGRCPHVTPFTSKTSTFGDGSSVTWTSGRTDASPGSLNVRRLILRNALCFEILSFSEELLVRIAFEKLGPESFDSRFDLFVFGV